MLRGATGVVTLDRELGVARKCSINEQARLGIEREYWLMTRLNHPHIVHVHRLITRPDRVEISMEACGKSLGDVVASGGAGLPESSVKAILRGLLDALRFVHLQGIVHGDVKPDNILRTKDDVVKLCDFGLGHMNHDRFPPTEDFAGTLRFMAPELFDETWKGSTRATDMWAVGCTAIELLTACPPWSEHVPCDLEPAATVLRLKTFFQAPNFRDAVQSALSRFSVDMQETVAPLLELDPADRPTADQLLQRPYFNSKGKSRRMCVWFNAARAHCQYGPSERQTDIRWRQESQRPKLRPHRTNGAHRKSLRSAASRATIFNLRAL